MRVCVPVRFVGGGVVIWRLGPRTLVQFAIVAAALGATYWRYTEPERLREMESALAGNDVKNALRLSLDYIDRHGRSSRASLVAARCLSRLIYPNRAEPYYAAAGTLARFPAPVLVERALGLFRGNQRDAAVQAFREILARYPDDPAALQYFATLQWTRGLYDEALALAARLAKQPGKSVVGLTMLGTYNYEIARHAQAAAAYERILSADPKLAAMPLPKALFWKEYITSLLQSGRARDAEAALVELRGEFSEPVFIDLLGLARFQQGDRAEAAAEWNRSIERDSARFFPHFQLGKLAVLEGRPAEALPHLETADRLEPNQYNVVRTLSTAHRMLGHEAEARRYVRAAEKLRAAQPASSGGMGSPPISQQ